MLLQKGVYCDGEKRSTKQQICCNKTNKHKIGKLSNNSKMFKKVSEYDQEISQSQKQTNSWHREEEPHNNNETLGRKTKQGNQLSIPFR